MPRVIVSSGHTNANPGTVANGLREADVARAIAKATLKYLRQNGIISLSLPPDMELAQRIDWINKSGYNETTNDLAIEVHINDGGKRGIETWYEGEGNNRSQKIAQAISDAVVAETNWQAQGVKSEYQHEMGSISFLHETIPIASLIECGYLDNLEDADFLRNPVNADLIGKGIAKGVLKYYNLEYRELPQPGSAQSVQTQPAQPTGTQPQLQNNATTVVNNQPANPYQPAIPIQPPSAAVQTNPYNTMPSRDERKQMIALYYTKILGREPNQNDLNYFLNIGIKEDELIRKMIDSQEHADLVKSRQEVIQSKQQLNDHQVELLQLRSTTKDQQSIIQNLSASINQKNYTLSKMQYMLSQYQQSKSGGGTKGSEPIPQYRGTFLDKLFKAFSDLFE